MWKVEREADGDRIGMLGLSMGGMEALWLAALDTRVDVVVSVAGHLAWHQVFESGAWKTYFADMRCATNSCSKGAEGEEARLAFFGSSPTLRR